MGGRVGVRVGVGARVVVDGAGVVNGGAVVGGPVVGVVVNVVGVVLVVGVMVTHGLSVVVTTDAPAAAVVAFPANAIVIPPTTITNAIDPAASIRETGPAGK
jgi:hypothetical protein